MKYFTWLKSSSSIKANANAKANAKEKMATTLNYLRIEARVGFMTQRPTSGHLEFVINYNINQSEPEQSDVLTLITPYVLETLGGTAEDWIIITHSDTTFGYSFEWKNLDNKLRSHPLQRMRGFHPVRDTTIINVP